ncbi:hypothetical protein M9194_19985 [Vibrio sp. S4M6]|uniref:hypothetical protein n=1 Tax=Vibrio sinus TaxID=2946865 RepID=UPI00202A5BA0|nr:hypothetical protein [Vibrio sinus]MCL9783708.1 hypothetical protein [Vibrio sinus]
MNYIRIVSSFLFALLGGWISKDNIEIAFLTQHSIIERSGMVNILAGYSCLLIGFYLTLFWVKKQFQISINIGDIKKVVGGLLVASLILAIITFSAINRQIEGYTECKDKRKLSSRYSSQTYAISPELCKSLITR